MRRSVSAFTLVEVIVATAVLTILVAVVARLFNATATVTTNSNKHIETDAQARPVLDRMAIDVAQMVRRADVDYYLKSSANTEAGNDQLAFYSSVSGYYPSTGSQSPVSLVSYRINSDSSSQALNKLERLGKGLVWNGVSASNTPIIFLPLRISTLWPAATSPVTDPQGDYEVIGPQIFRFEYYYVLKNGNLSDTPWDTSAGHTSVNGMRDVAAISVSVAAFDSKTRVLLDNSSQVPFPNDNITKLAGKLGDFPTTMGPGQLRTNWQDTLDNKKSPDADIAAMPRVAISAIRLYERYFYVP